jgi:hypothetical protein
MTEKQYAHLVAGLQEVDGCLLWTRGKYKSGYGAYLHKKVHNNGPVPKGKELAHSCPHKHCVRHVEPKTHYDNMQDYFYRDCTT